MDTEAVLPVLQEASAEVAPPAAPAEASKASSPDPPAAEINKTTSASPRWIPSDVLRKRLALRSHSAVDEIYQIAQQQLDDEDKRDSGLTTKANTMLGAAGLSTTVAFSFGAFLLQHPELMSTGYCLAVGLFILSIICGLLASVLALCSLRISGYEYVNETAVFNEDNFRDVNAAFDVGWKANPPNTREEAADRAALSVFRRYLAAHLWGIYQRTHPKLERKAETVKWAQRLYIAFLFMILGLALTLSAAALARRTAPDKVGVPLKVTASPATGEHTDAQSTDRHDTAIAGGD